jgi:hypothetical protein
MIFSTDGVKNSKLLFLVFIYSVTLTTGAKISLRKYSDKELIGSNFPIVADRFLPLSEQCVNDTVSQLAALRNRLPWAIESKLRFETRTNLEFSILIFKTNKSSVRIFWLTDGQNG